MNDDMICYITEFKDIVRFVPKSCDDGKHINQRWVVYLSVLQDKWENGDKNIYALMRTKPEPDFVLTNESLKAPPVDKISGEVDKNI